MIRHLATGLVFAAVTTVSSLAVAEDGVVVYATVDAIQADGEEITVTGIIAGQNAPSTTHYFLGFRNRVGEIVARCERFALLAMSKPGKFQLTLVPIDLNGPFSCKLSLRTP